MLPTYDLPKVVERNYPSFNGRARMNWCDGVWKSWNDSEKFEIGVFFDKSTNFEATFENKGRKVNGDKTIVKITLDLKD